MRLFLRLGQQLWRAGLEDEQKPCAIWGVYLLRVTLAYQTKVRSTIGLLINPERLLYLFKFV